MNKYLDDFMKTFPYEGLTYDDVTLVTQYADFLPDDTSLETKLTSRTKMKVPFMSAAMDTVTEAPMAIAMALAGGIGCIHKNLEEDEQAAQVRLVKNHLNGMIENPVCFHASDDIGFLRSVKAERKLKFNGFPVLDDNERLVGMITSSDMRFAPLNAAKLSDVMQTKLLTAKPGTSLKKAYEIMRENKIGKLPLVDKDGRIVGLYSFTDVHRIVENPNTSVNCDDKFRLRVSASVSGGKGDLSRMEKLADAGVDVVVVDSAHGHSKGIMDMTKYIVKHFPKVDVIAGNIATGEAALALAKAGAHAVKVGIGPGSICTTRVVCGVGIPQLTAVYSAAKALRGTDVAVIADGGIKLSGDVPKAIAAGADSVMLGSVLAGTEESPGEKIYSNGRQYVVYRGMGSMAALKNGKGSRARYFQDNEEEDSLVPQGIEGMVPYSGHVKSIMTQFCGGLRASLGYCGARTIAELKEKGKFYRVTAAGLREARPHDITITKEAPNYRT
ncbi:MAG: IMP dehydrogenase [Kiritimatiellae bacterium]|nr:IMP dehydrogenase [Kiritimatiellia bacterium]